VLTNQDYRLGHRFVKKHEWVILASPARRIGLVWRKKPMASGCGEGAGMPVTVWKREAGLGLGFAFVRQVG